jgi:hypothetical protein
MAQMWLDHISLRTMASHAIALFISYALSHLGEINLRIASAGITIVVDHEKFADFVNAGVFIVLHQLHMLGKNKLPFLAKWT